MDIRINPDNKLSVYPSAWRLILFMYFLCSFENFYAILQKFCTLIRVSPEFFDWDYLTGVDSDHVVKFRGDPFVK